MIEKHELFFAHNGFFGTFRARLKTDEEMAQALATLPEIALPGGYAPERLLEFNASDLPYQPAENFVFVQYARDGKRAHVFHYFGEDCLYERVVVSPQITLFYSGKWLGFNGEVDAHLTPDLSDAYARHASKIGSAQRFLLT